MCGANQSGLWADRQVVRWWNSHLDIWTVHTRDTPCGGTGRADNGPRLAMRCRLHTGAVREDLPPRRRKPWNQLRSAAERRRSEKD